MMCSSNSLPSISKANNIHTLLLAREPEPILPPTHIQNITQKCVNTLNELNVQTKGEELCDFIGDQYWPWFAQYFTWRVSIDVELHGVYFKFLKLLKLHNVYLMVTNETIRNIKVLLRSNKIHTNYNDRCLLKNLGGWLGMLTLGQNKPILQKDIDLKSVALEAYHTGQQELLYVLPLITKILEICTISKVFKPPNPWTMGIIKVLFRIYRDKNIKINLIYQIEMIFKTLDLKTAQLELKFNTFRELNNPPLQPASNDSVLNVDLSAMALPFNQRIFQELPTITGQVFDSLPQTCWLPTNSWPPPQCVYILYPNILFPNCLYPYVLYPYILSNLYPNHVGSPASDLSR